MVPGETTEFLLGRQEVINKRKRQAAMMWVDPKSSLAFKEICFVYFVGNS